MTSIRDQPLLMLSASVRELDAEMALAAGADQYMTKPFDKRELLERLGSIMAG
jgi:DNA-binding response OmpR family regulator